MVEEQEVKEKDIPMDEPQQSETSRLVASPTPTARNSPKYLHILSNLLALIFIGIISYCAFSDEILLFSFHPFLMSVGWLLFMAVAINSITPGDLATEWMPIRLRSTRHWIVQAIACTLVVAGFIVIVVNKFIMAKEHFVTVHSKVGLASLVFMAATITGGICTLYSLKLKHLVPPLVTKLIHSSAGVFTFTLGIVAMYEALFSVWFVNSGYSSLQYYCVALLLGVLVLTILRPALKIYFRIKERFEVNQ